MSTGFPSSSARRLLRPRLRSLSLLAGLLVALGLAHAATAGDEPRPPAKTALPPELDAVPRDALGFVSLRVADLWNSAVAADLRKRLAQEDPTGYRKAETEALQEFEKNLGVPLPSVERLTVVGLEFQHPDRAILLVTSAKPYDRDRLLKVLVPDAKETKYAGHSYWRLDKGPWALYVLNDRTYALGKDAQTMEGFLDQLGDKRNGGPLSAALKLAAARHQLVGGLNPAQFAPLRTERWAAEVEPFKPLLDARSAALAVDIAKDVRLELSLTFADADQAKEGEKAVKAGRDMARRFLAQGMKELAKEEGVASLLQAVKQIDAMLKGMLVEQQRSAVQVTLPKIDGSAVVDVMVPTVIKVREADQRIAAGNNLKNIGLALHEYHDTYGHFPPAAIYSKDGKPLLSWRVAILPYIDEQDLYKQFHLDEPWDSEHNKKLLAKMPKVYAPTLPGLTKDPYASFYQGFTGKGAIFEGKEGVSLTQITDADGAANTLLVVEAREAVPWTKPQDLHYDPDKPPPKLGGHFRNISPALFADGSVRNLSNKLKEKTIRALITWNGGETIKESDYSPE
jgi:hypothetical protein